MDNEEVWSKAYLPTERTTEARGNYEGKVIFNHVQIRLVASNEPLMGCEPLSDWLRKKCLAIYKRHVCGEENQVGKRNCKAALDSAREYYGDRKLK